MVTKPQQLEWLAESHDSWPYIGPVMIMSDESIGAYYGAPMPGCHFVSFTEWQQERDKMQKQTAQPAQPEPDNSWHEHGEFPPVGCECEVFVNDENKWMHFEAIAIRDGHVLGWCREVSCGFQSKEKSEFRPLRTEREKAIDEMVDIMRETKRANLDVNAAALYDAGYRKQ